MSQNPFAIADRKFINLESATVHKVRFRFAPVRQFLESVTTAFRTIDFADDYQAELGRNLWRLRCSVLFSLAPYDHEELELLAQGERVLTMADRLPGCKEVASKLMEQLLVLLEQKENPKLEWIMRQDWEDGNPAAVFALMAMKKSFGSDLIAQLTGYPANCPQVIRSLDQIGNGEYSTVVIPGTSQYLSQSLFMKLFHLGEYSRIYVLLYEGETFRPKERLLLPESSLLPGGSQGKDLYIERSDVVDSSDDVGSDVDKFIAGRIFSFPGEAALGEGHGIPSRFVLCDDGKGFHVAEKERIRVWRPNGSDRLVPVFPVQLSEGDFVILEQGGRSELLELTDNRQEFEAGLDATRLWRKPLQALLLSRSFEEVANLMCRTGRIPERTANRNLQANLANWAEERVYGPGDLQHMLALIQVLVDSGLLQIDSSPEDSARQWFEDLEKLRAGRRAAGIHVRDEIDHLLEDSLGELAPLGDGLEVKLDNGMVVTLHQLAMIGDQVSRVPESLLRKPI